MKKGATLSAALHASVILVGWVGLPFLREPPIVPDQTIVEVVNALPKPEAKPEEPKPTPQPQEQAAAPPVPPPPPAPPQIAPPAPPTPPAQPEPRPEAVPLPQPKPKPEPPKEQAKPAEPSVDPKPQDKPQPPTKNLMASVLKTVEQLKDESKKQEKKQPPAEQAPAKETPQVSSIDRQNREQQLSNLVRQQMKQCWNYDPGGKDVRSMVAEIRIQLAPDGTVQRAELRDSGRASADGAYRAFAESAVRAVLNPRCNPMKLPPDSYDIWRDMTLVFSPKDLV